MLVHKGGQINNVQLITGVGGVGVRGICEQRSEAFVKIKKKLFFFFFGGGGGGGVGFGLGGGGVRVDVN